MNISLSVCKLQVEPPVNFHGGLSTEPPFFHHQYRKDRVVVILGATGTGKSRLAIDLSDRCFLPGEIVNSDKMQIYKGLDITTNKITEEERNMVPHHLLSIAEPDSNFTADDFCYHASSAVDSIVKKDRLPIIAGGSNSYVESLVNDYPSFPLRYEFCFLWVDVSLPILHSFVSDRVDRMVEAGLVDEVRAIFDPSLADYSRGIRKAIGVPELDRFLRTEAVADERTKRRFLEAAIAEIKLNTCKLACRQLQKIHRLHGMWKWNMHRLDATEVFLKSGKEAEEAWKEFVVAKAKRIVDKFLDGKRRVFDGEERVAATMVSPESAVIAAPPPMTMAAVAAARR